MYSFSLLARFLQTRAEACDERRDERGRVREERGDVSGAQIYAMQCEKGVQVGAHCCYAHVLFFSVDWQKQSRLERPRPAHTTNYFCKKEWSAPASHPTTV